VTHPDPAPEVGTTDVKAGLGVLLATCISALVVNANTSAVSILLPSIGEDVGAPVSTLQWAVTGYSLVGAAFIVTAGALGDVFGRRRIFMGGLALFIASCVMIALTDSAAGVIGGRAIQGAAGSTILACGLSLLTVASSGAAPEGCLALGSGVCDRRCSRPSGRRSPRRHGGMAGTVLDRRRDRRSLRAAHPASGRGVIGPEPLPQH
jgi:hypothetical protein